MAYDEALADRVRVLLPGARERSMFGGLGFLLDGGHMAVCVSGRGTGLLVRVEREDADVLAAIEGVEPMEMAGRTSRTWMVVAPGLLADDDDLEAWVRRGESVAAALPPKT
ncbi:TfoX/Sxy family protein [Nocardioides sp. CFH 31398]|uniref:TfoX/Sxy family protein n=1 Tax=Nocardioides sp. CFH 31398 TaxID=2919579 RepID=UPI001F06848D|nr:TfoX/Sxy family protein [Nocardioides sp. CFH 31398]MCH1867806.1 TfoX/Sxy family protein [Nocardioides sp. CFH 31398]